MRTALLDANVLYSAVLRDIFLQLAAAGLFNARWSDEIHQEWLSALLRNEPWRDGAALDRTRDLMDRSVKNCLVTNYEHLISGLFLPDPKDRHVLAAAIVGHCDIIVTNDLLDFPALVLEPLGIKTQHPDEFLTYHLNLAPTDFFEGGRRLRARLVNPPYTVDEYLGILTQQRLGTTAMKLQTLAHLL